MIGKIIGVKKNEINKAAFRNKSSLRIPNKLWADKMVEAFCECSAHDEFSFKNICDHLDDEYNITISKQALAQRVNRSGTVALFLEIVKSCFLKSINYEKSDFESLREYIKRVLVQDSTIVLLPKHLHKYFSGVSKTAGNARIQFIYDLLNMDFISFSIDSYSKNDLASALEIDVLEGDLWLRDKGYFNLDACYKIDDYCGDYILRYKIGTNLYHLDGRPFDLMNELKKNSSINKEVLVGEKRIPMNLVVNRANIQIANERRRKANLKYGYSSEKKKSEEKVMTKEYSYLCNFTIFLTSFNLKLTFKQIFALYALRWRIEIIFKAWKSNLNFANIHNVSYYQFHILICCRFIVNHLIFNKFYKDFLERVLQKHNKILSIMALTKSIMLKFEHYLDALINNEIEYLTDKFSRFCTYEKRKRKNYYEMEQTTFENLNEFYLI